MISQGEKMILTVFQESVFHGTGLKLFISVSDVDLFAIERRRRSP
jgi:hypothetical protein